MSHPTPAPTGLEDAELHVYREVAGMGLPLYILRPAGDKNGPGPAFVGFFGGGWRTGSPSRLLPLARQLVAWGVTAILADYRTEERFGTGPKEAVADALAVVPWVLQHATQLRVDPARLWVGGMSAGGYLALRAALASPSCAGLILFFPVSDFGPTGHTAAAEHFLLDLNHLSIGPLLPRECPP